MQNEVWTWGNKDGTRTPYYTAADIVAKYIALHGDPGVPRRAATTEETEAAERYRVLHALACESRKPEDFATADAAYAESVALMRRVSL